MDALADGDLDIEAGEGAAIPLARDPAERGVQPELKVVEQGSGPFCGLDGIAALA